MDKLTLYFMKGLPASGKTTRALELVRDGMAHRVNKDDIRMMMFNGDYHSDLERTVIEIERFVVRKLLNQGHSVVVDNTHLNPYHENEYRGMADFFGAEFEVILCDTPLETCLERDRNRERQVGDEVIIQMHDRAKRKGYL